MGIGIVLSSWLSGQWTRRILYFVSRNVATCNKRQSNEKRKKYEYFIDIPLTRTRKNDPRDQYLWKSTKVYDVRLGANLSRQKRQNSQCCILYYVITGK